MTSSDDIRKIIEGVFAPGSGAANVFGDLFGGLKPQVVVCKACGQKNRLRPGKKDARCGKCGLPLGAT